MNQVAHIHTEPHNVEAEQQALGTALARNDLIPTIQAAGGSDLFFDPVHADIFARAMHLAKSNMLASPVSMKEWAGAHEGIRELGGPSYLARLVGVSISPDQIQSYVDILTEAKARRTLSQALTEAQAAISKGEDPASVISGRLEASLLASQVDSSTGPVSMTKAVTKAMQQAIAAYHGEEDGFVHSGIGYLDRMIGGFYNGELTLIGGRPSMGKTALALSIALNVARDGKKVCIASLEMNPEAMAMRAISEGTSYGGETVYYSKLRQGEFSEKQGHSASDSAKLLADLPIQFLSRNHSDVGALMAGVKQSERIMDGVDLVIVDYAQLLRSTARSRYEQITEISIALKGLAGQLDAPVIALSQLSRAVEQRDDKRPIMSDLRESGQLEQDADTVLFCYRPEYYLERVEPEFGDEAREEWEDAMRRKRHAMEIIVAKQRQGEIGTAYVKCNPALNKIWEQ